MKIIREPLRDWLEGKRWYWFHIHLTLNIFPYHWEMNTEKYDWGWIAKFGPFGIFVSWR